MAGNPILYGANNKPLNPCGCPATGCEQGCLAGNARVFPKKLLHNAADAFSEGMKGWTPQYTEFDESYCDERESITARILDLIRNNGKISGELQSMIDRTVGSYFKLIPTPIQEILGWTDEEYEKYISDKKALFKHDMESSRSYIDAEGKKDFAQIIGLCYRMNWTHGEFFASIEHLKYPFYRPFRTAVHAFDPGRVYDPDILMENKRVKDGVLRDKFNSPLGYFIFDKSRQSCDFAGPENKARYVRKYTSWGRPQIIHSFQQEGAHQTRGRSPAVSIVQATKKAERVISAGVQHNVLQNMYALFIESDYPDIGDAINAQKAVGKAVWDDGTPVTAAQMRFIEMQRFGNKMNIEYNNAKAIRGYPGEKANLLSPSSNYQGTSTLLEKLDEESAAGLRSSLSSLTRNFSKTNYSGAKQGDNDTYRFAVNERKTRCEGPADEITYSWEEEAIMTGRLCLPDRFNSTNVKKRMEYFWRNREAICRNAWMPPKRDSLDPNKLATQAKTLSELDYENQEEWLMTNKNRDLEDHYKQQKRQQRVRAKVFGEDETVDETRLNRKINQKSFDTDKTIDEVRRLSRLVEDMTDRLEEIGTS